MELLFRLLFWGRVVARPAPKPVVQEPKKAPDSYWDFRWSC